MPRLTSGLTFVMLCLTPPALAPSDVGPTALKGIRAIIVYGQPLNAPVRIVDFDAATTLYVYLARPIGYGDALPSPDLEKRTCVGIALFLPASRTAPIPVDSLEPEQGDFHYWLYPAVGAKPAILFASRAFPVYAEALAELSRYKVPVKLEPSSAAHCDRPLGSRE
jgi:hypothetical protein